MTEERTEPIEAEAIEEEDEPVRVPVYLITGFLESGKSTFLDYTVRQQYFKIEGKSLLVACEQGEIEFDEDVLRDNHTVLVNVEDKDAFTEDFLQQLENTEHPERVMLEYNPLWTMQDLFAMKLPEGWGFVQQIVTVDASTFQVYMNNMKALFRDMVLNADMVIFNRCNQEMPLANFRRSIKVVNPAGEVLFETESGEMTDIFENSVPYDLDADVIDIEDVDYGIFFVDLTDDPEKYMGKTVRFKGQVMKIADAEADYFVPGRYAMTCCADDMQFLGYVCKSKNAAKLLYGSWVEVTAEIGWEYMPAYHREGPVFRAKAIKSAKAPQVELVYFS